jgi:hypothetical protein
MNINVPEPFQGVFDQIYAAIASGEVDMDFAVEFTNILAQGCWGHINKLLNIAGL